MESERRNTVGVDIVPPLLLRMTYPNNPPNLLHYIRFVYNFRVYIVVYRVVYSR